MKKMLAASVAAVALVAVVQQEASAWCKFTFGAGFNTSFECANNSVLWGLIKSGPAPCQNPCDSSVGPGMCGAYQGHITDGAIGYPPPADGHKPAPKEGEKIAPPMPVKPATYLQYLPQTQAQPAQAGDNTQEEPEYYYPSYYYGR